MQPRQPGKRFSLNQIGIRRSRSDFFSDLYPLLLTISWLNFLGLTASFYLIVNTFFAFAYLVSGDGIANARPGSFVDAFFFSFQTLATIGYGAMYPTTVYTNLVAALEALVGLLGFALITGLMFAKVSRPTARIMFSQVAVITQHDGLSTLMFRTANQRGNQIVEAQIRVTLTRDEITPEGEIMRRLYDLKLVRHITPLFIYTWNVMHPIDSSSPLYGATPEMLAKWETMFIVTITGLDETYAQTVHARHTFFANDILWNHRFANILLKDPQGDRYIDYSQFHTVIPIQETAQISSIP